MNKHKLNLDKIIEKVTVFNFLALIFLSVYRCVIEDNSFQSLYNAPGHRSMLVPINPNHADDVFVSLMLLNGICLVHHWSKDKINFPLFGVSLLLIVTYGFLFLQLNSEGGIIGLAAGIISSLAVAFLLMRSKNWSKLFCASFFILVLFAVFSETSLFGNHIKQLSVFLEEGELLKFRKSICDVTDEFGYPLLSVPYSLSPSVSYRIGIWSNAMDIWRASPIFGHGLYDSEHFLSRNNELQACLMRQFVHTHNLYVDLLVHGGLLFLLFYACIIGFILKNIIKKIREDMKYERVNIFSYFFLTFVVFLIVENFFDLSFVASNRLVACLMIMSCLWIIAHFLNKNELPVSHAK